MHERKEGEEILDQYYGRSEEIEGEIIYQLLIEHLNNVANICGQFVGQVSDEKIGIFLGYMHDIGKYSEDFQRRIRGENIKVAHADAGAKVAEKIYQQLNRMNPIYRLLVYVIYGHHSGLANYGTPAKGLCKNLKEEGCDCRAWEKEIKGIPELSPKDIKLRLRESKQSMGFTLQFYTRYLLSCLVDADRIDAQNFPYEEATLWMKQTTSLQELKEKYERYMASLHGKAKPSKLNSIRNEILNSCLTKAQGRRGFYSLTVPTGGGKTLSSLGFALYHAVANEQKRVIYTIPFTSIIEQNAEVFARVLGRNNVVEHHSNYENPYKTKEELLKFQLAQENWYEPIIVTTNVQFFETLFSNKPSKVRKLHNISNSIIILDEIQSIPNKYIKPCLAALNELVINYDCTIVLCSATQPEYDKNKLFLEEVKIEEIIDDPQKLFKELRRTKEYYIGHQTIEDLAERLQSEEQALCIVNTKKHAKDLFEMLGQEDNHFHLSTHMYPVHRKEVISQIKELLQEGMPCKVISTQLIEAGVDIDFPKVYRSLSGIDSIVQAGGRCNREGKLEQGEVYVFKPEEKYIGKEYLALTAAIGEMCIGVQEDFLGLESISHYFSQLFDITTQKLDAYNVLGICEASLENPKDIRIAFEDLADNFKFIQNEGYPIIIPDTEQVEILLDQIKYSKNPKGLLRKLAPYTVTVKKYELDALKEYGALNIIEGNLLVLNDLNFYDHKLGLVITLKEDDFEYVI